MSKPTYEELYTVLDKASEWLNEMGCEHDEDNPDMGCIVCLVNTTLAKK